MKSVVIEHLKGIKHLEFTLPTRNGVYLLAGANGAGKTTLLTCLWRIGEPKAFQLGFRAANVSGVDVYSQAKIEYRVGERAVFFKHPNIRWSPTPRRNSHEVLKAYGYSDVVYIGADAKRISGTQDEINAGRYRAASPDVIEAMNDAFSTNRFNTLRRIENKNGKRWFRYFYIMKDEATGERYSEKRFSSGEIALLRVFGDLDNLEPGSLVLIDEGELALHPKAQANLLDYLRSFAERKSATVIISTHSSTMISAADPDHIILIERRHGKESLVNPCYPARALGNIDSITSVMADYLVFVEDEMARQVFMAMQARYFVLEPKDPHLGASVMPIPVGTYLSTAEMAVNARRRRVFSSHVCVKAALDHDAFEAAEKARRGNSKGSDPDLYKLIKNNPETIVDLGFTPEVRLVEVLLNDDDLDEEIRARFRYEPSELRDVVVEAGGDKQSERKRAKSRFRKAVQVLEDKTGDGEETVRRDLIKILVNHFDAGELRAAVGTVFCAKR